jgi:hypothetical protein
MPDRHSGHRCAQRDKSQLHQWDHCLPERQGPTGMQVDDGCSGTIAFLHASRGCVHEDKSQSHQWEHCLPERRWPTGMQVDDGCNGTIAFLHSGHRCVQRDNPELHQWEHCLPERQWPTGMQVADARTGTIAFLHSGHRCVHGGNSQLHQWDHSLPERQWLTGTQVGDGCNGTIPNCTSGTIVSPSGSGLPARRLTMCAEGQLHSRAVVDRCPMSTIGIRRGRRYCAIRLTQSGEARCRIEARARMPFAPGGSGVCEGQMPPRAQWQGRLLAAKIVRSYGDLFSPGGKRLEPSAEGSL